MSEMKIAKTAPEKPAANPWANWPSPFFRGNLFQVNPFALMREFTEEMDKMFGYPAPGGKTEYWMPVVEVKKSNGNIAIQAELPGMTKENVKVSMTDEAVILEGERKEETEEKGEEFYRSERSYGKFYREVALPEGVDADKATAEFTDGMLKISMPCVEKKETKKEVPVTEGAPKAA